MQVSSACPARAEKLHLVVGEFETVVRTQRVSDGLDRFARNVFDFSARVADGVMVMRLVAHNERRLTALVDPSARFALSGQQIESPVDSGERYVGPRFP
jgi:hypothetical protein